MSIGTGDLVVKEGVQKTLEANGAAVANGVMVQANGASYDRLIDGGGAPDAKFVLGFVVGTSGVANTLVDLYVKRLGIDAANNAQPPAANYLQESVGSFKYDNSIITIQYAEFDARDLPSNGDYYILNNTGQLISAGWSLKITPTTIGQKV